MHAAIHQRRLAFWRQVHVVGVEPAAARLVRERVAGLLAPAELAA